MRIQRIQIPLQVQEKIFKKHSVKAEEIECLFLHDKPLFFHARSKRYMAIGFVHRYVTAIFEYETAVATIITAYCSSSWQKKIYLK